jgi:hypothetical protein
MGSLYERDFHPWCLEQARLLRELRNSKEVPDLDVEHVAEGMESLALEQRAQLEDYLAALMAYRLQYEYQRTDHARERDWLAKIVGPQQNIERWLKESPSLRAFLPEAVEDAYQSARIFAGTFNDFPQPCPYTFEQLLMRTSELPPAEENGG